MVVVHRAFGMRFIIYKDDHEPAHVHVRGDGEVKVVLVGPDGDPKIVKREGEMTRADERRILREIGKRQFELLRHWKQIHG
jgi:tRNA pseudouridine-54 N-methylase